MRHARIERWSLGDSIIHRRHAAAKILATLVLLISIATLTAHTALICLVYLVLLLIGAVAARLPLLAVAGVAAAVLPFALCFGIVSTLTGDFSRGVMLLVRAYLSAFAVALLVGTTPMPNLIAGLEWLRAPAFLLQVMQFLYRYLIVLMEEAAMMRQASEARGGTIRRIRFHHAAAAAGVLFARSWARALAIHRAMISRGFEGRIPAFRRKAFSLPDAGFAASAAVIVTGLRIALR